MIINIGTKRTCNSWSNFLSCVLCLMYALRLSTSSAFMPSRSTIYSFRSDDIRKLRKINSSINLLNFDNFIPKVKSNTKREQNESESNSKSSYYEELREAAKDPKKFEEFVTKSSSQTDTKEEKSTNQQNSDEANEEGSGKKSGYQRVEDWDNDLKNKKDGSGMTWEEKVQYDGLRFGNQVKQNNILQKHLNGF